MKSTTEALLVIARAIDGHTKAVQDQTKELQRTADRFFTFVGFDRCTPPNTLDVCVNDFAKLIAGSLDGISTALVTVSDSLDDSHKRG